MKLDGFGIFVDDMAKMVSRKFNRNRLFRKRIRKIKIGFMNEYGTKVI